MKTNPETEVSARFLNDNIGEITNRVAYGREQITVTKYGKPLCKIVPIEREKEKSAK